MATKGANANACIAALVIGDSSDANYVAYNNSNCYIGVGDSSAAESSAHTDLQASTNKLRKGMYDGTFPSRSGAVVTRKAKFLDGEAQYAWSEMAVFNGSSAKTMLYRDLNGGSGWGTKVAGEEWHITITETWA